MSTTALELRVGSQFRPGKRGLFLSYYLARILRTARMLTEGSSWQEAMGLSRYGLNDQYYLEHDGQAGPGANPSNGVRT
jgi:hypothetical protein